MLSQTCFLAAKIPLGSVTSNLIVAKRIPNEAASHLDDASPWSAWRNDITQDFDSLGAELGEQTSDESPLKRLAGLIVINKETVVTVLVLLTILERAVDDEGEFVPGGLGLEFIKLVLLDEEIVLFVTLILVGELDTIIRVFLLREHLLPLNLLRVGGNHVLRYKDTVSFIDGHIENIELALLFLKDMAPIMLQISMLWFILWRQFVFGSNLLLGNISVDSLGGF